MKKPVWAVLLTLLTTPTALLLLNAVAAAAAAGDDETFRFQNCKIFLFPSRSSVLCSEEEANSNSYTHWFSIKQRVVETKRITIVCQKNTGGLS